MTHMHIPTVPTARDRRLAAERGGKVGVWSGYGTSPVGYSGRHVRTFRKHERQQPFDSENAARCKSETRADMSTPGDGMGRLLRRCSNSVCPKHEPVAYAECMARHTPETLVERAGMLMFLSEYDQFARHARAEFIGRYVDVNL